jgi:hypothetical protein
MTIQKSDLPLTVKNADGSVSSIPVYQLTFSNGTLSSSSPGQVTYSPPAGGSSAVYAPTGGNYIAFLADGDLTNEKVLTAGSSVTTHTDATAIYINATTATPIVYAPTGGNFLAFSADANLTAERVVAASDNITIVSSGTSFLISATTNGAVAGAPSDGEYITYAANGSLSAEKTLTAGSSVTTHTDSTAFYVNATTNANIAGSNYVTFLADAALSNEKILTAGNSVTITTGATTVTINAVTNALASTGVSITRITFNSNNLTSGGSGALIASHNLAQQFVSVAMYDSTNNIAFPDSYNLNSNSSLQVDLDSWGVITGTWHLVMVG